MAIGALPLRMTADPSECRTDRPRASLLGGRSNTREPNGLARVSDGDLPQASGPRLDEAQLVVDAEHLRVRVRVPGADEKRLRTFVEDALQHHGLHPHAQAMPAVAVDHRGPLLPDDVRDLRIVGDLGEPRAFPAPLVHRDEQPPLRPRLLEPRFALAD